MTGIHGKEKIFPWFKRAAAVVALLVLILPAAAWPAPVTPVQPDNEDDDDGPVVEMQAEPDDEPATAPAPAVEGQPAQPAAPVQQPEAVPAPPAQPEAVQPAPPAETQPALQQPQPGTPQPAQPAAQPPVVPEEAKPAEPATVQPVQPVQPGVTQPARPAAAQPPRPAAKPRSADVSFNFDDADVFSVIQTIFGDILRVNYVVDPQVKGRVTYRSVAPVPRENVLPLMEVILRMNGIAIVEDAGLYRIIPIADIPREPARLEFGRDPSQVQVTGKAMIQVVPMQYVTSTDVVKVLTPFASANAQIIDAPKSNHIIIIDTASNVKRLLSIIDVFDSEQLRRVRPQVYVYPVQNSKAKDVTNILTQIFLGGKSSGSVRSATAAKPTTPGQPAQAQAQAQAAAETTPGPSGDLLVSDVTRIFADDIANTIIILATRGDYELIEETIKKIDIQPRQVVIEGLIAQVALTDNLSMGLAWSLKTDVNFSLKPFDNDYNLKGEMGSNAPLPDVSGLSHSGFSFVATDASGIVRARLEALATESKAKVLAAPHILVSDNREARIQVGQQVPLVTSSTNVTGTTDIQRTIQYKDIGIILKVKPQVNDSGLVSLEITQEVSSLGASISFGDDTSAPTLNKTEATTNLVAQNGQTIIIGGLIRDDSTKDKSGIPFLSRIPLIGWLFGNWSDLETRTELVILLTPRVIRTQTEASVVTNDYVNKYKGMDKDLQKRLDGPQDKQQQQP